MHRSAGDLYNHSVGPESYHVDKSWLPSLTPTCTDKIYRLLQNEHFRQTNSIPKHKNSIKTNELQYLIQITQNLLVQVKNTCTFDFVELLIGTSCAVLGDTTSKRSFNC